MSATFGGMPATVTVPLAWMSGEETPPTVTLPSTAAPETDVPSRTVYAPV